MPLSNLKPIPATIMLLLGAGALAAADVYVDAKNGQDSNPGTMAAPLLTIKQASARLKPGDRCILRSGTYREAIVPVSSGETGKPIIYAAAKDEKVTLSALDPVTGWQPDRDGVYKAPAPKGASAGTVLAEGKRATEARWPKATADSFIDCPRASVKEVDATPDLDKGKNIIVDPELPSTFTEEGLKGARIWYLQWYNGWWSSGDHVTRFDAAKKSLTISKMIMSSDRERHGNLPFTYVLLGKRELLTDDREWALDNGTRTLYYKAPGGRDPSHDGVEITVRGTGVDLKGRSNIEVDGIRFLGYGISGDEATSQCRIHGCTFLYGNSIRVNGSGNEISNCELAYHKSNVYMVIDGKRNRVVNNYFHHTGEESGFAVQIRGEEHLFAYNTMEHAGDRFVGIDGIACQVVHNRFRECALLCRDAGSIHTGGDGGGTEIAYNLSLSDYRKLHYVSGIYLDNRASHFLVHHNVIPVVALNAPKNNVLVFNNTIYRFSDYKPHGDEDLPLDGKRNSLPIGEAGDFANTVYANNIFAFEAKPTPGLGFANNLDSIDPSAVFNDRTGRKLDTLEEPWTYDFTLKPGSPAIGAGMPIEGITDGYPKPPDIGAFDSGKPAWQAGCDLTITRDVTFTRPRYQYMNLLENQGFEIGETLDPWVLTGSKSATRLASKSVGWGVTDGDEARLKGAALLGAGINGLEQRVTGLTPGERYIFWMWVRPKSPQQRVQIGIRYGAGLEEATAIGQVTGWTRMFVHVTLPPGVSEATVFVRKLTDDPGQITADQASFSREWLAVAKPVLPGKATRFVAVEDTYVMAMQPKRSFGYHGSAALKDGNQKSPKDVRHPFLKFDLTPLRGKQIGKATLRIYTTLSSKATMPVIEVREVPDENWTARGDKPITWENQPQSADVVARFTAKEAGWITCDVTEFVRKRLGKSGIVGVSLSDPDRTGNYVTVMTSQMMNCPPTPSYPPSIDIEQ